jgi:hypothetical protein
MFLDESAFDVEEVMGVPNLSATPKNVPEIKSGRYNNSSGKCLF